ncbi:MAG: hypothetical protein V7642_1335 [Burkholderiales bacterium]|jgi:hypothetical protein
MTGVSLYVIANEHRAMVERLMNGQEDPQTIADTIEAESHPLEVKAQNVAFAIRNLEATAAAIRQAEQEMAARRKRIENRAQQVRDYLQTCMEIANVSRIECPHFALAIKHNPPSVEVFEPDLVPEEYRKTPEPAESAIDKAAIREAIKANKKVPGVMLVQGSRLEIK